MSRLTCWALGIFVLGILGCGSEQPTAGDPAETAWRNALDAVRRGETDAIRLEEIQVSEAMLSKLIEVPELRVLEVTARQDADPSLKFLEKLTRLERLTVGGLTVDDDGAARIGRIESLRILNLPQSEITDEGLAHLAKLPRLELLRIYSTHISDAGMSSIAKMKALRFLHLRFVDITDAGLEPLKTMEWLESLYLDGVSVSEEALTELTTALPNLHLHIDDLHLPGDPHADH